MISMVTETTIDIEAYLVSLWESEYPEQSPDFPRFYRWEKRILPISSVKHHKPADIEKAKRYAQEMADGATFPPLVVLQAGNGQYELLNGYHRIFAAKSNGWIAIPAFVGSKK